jgi:hypothetical protein
MPAAAQTALTPHRSPAMPRRNRRAPMAPMSDLGPAIRHQRGELVTEDAPDPGAPNRTVRRARQEWAPDVLRRNGTIGDAQHQAATRLHDAYALGILGARDRMGVYIDRTGGPSGYADAQLAAAADYRRAAQAVGQVGMAALAWCVISTGTVAGWAECKGWPVPRAQGYLLAALDRLTEHYQLTD